MKKICLIVFCMSFVSSLFGQEILEYQPKIKDFSSFKTKNEIQTNVFNNLLYINLSYERIISENISINATFRISIEDHNNIDRPVNAKNIFYSNIKYYFGYDICNEWFIKLGVGLLNYKEAILDNDDSIKSIAEFITTGAAVGAGYKFIIYENWFIELGLEAVIGYIPVKYSQIVGLNGINENFPYFMAVTVGKRF